MSVIVFLVVVMFGTGGVVLATTIARMQMANRALRERTAHLEREFGDVSRKAALERGLTEAIRHLEVTHKARTEQLEATERAFQMRLSRLQYGVDALEEQDGFHRVGFYQPRLDLRDASEYEKKLDDVRELQKSMLRAGTAAGRSTDGPVGKPLAPHHHDDVRLVLRAFNGECDAAVAKVRRANAAAMEKRLLAAFEAVNEDGASRGVEIAARYLDLKVQELFIAQEMADKNDAEIAVQRGAPFPSREEERMQRELQRASEEAEVETRRYEKALARARYDVSFATGKARIALEKKLVQLTERFAEASANRDRALLRASGPAASGTYRAPGASALPETSSRTG